MRQVPQYLIIGNGRLSKHFQHYFSLLSIPYQLWHRALSIDTLALLVKSATHILVLIKDDAIESFIRDHLIDVSAIRIHCSGSLVTELAVGAHPTYCFNERHYELHEYLEIPFIVDADGPAFNTLLPGLPNRHMRLDKTLKAKYHALCVMGANFSCLLWQKLFTDFEKELAIPSHYAHPYLRQQMQNLMHDHKMALTGPLVRNDQQTIASNLKALAHDPIQAVYESFVKYYQQVNGGK